MKLYLKRNTRGRGQGDFLIHGIDYTKGLEDGRCCGIAHEFWTKGCLPVVFTEEEMLAWNCPEDFVEVTPWRGADMKTNSVTYA